MNKTKLAQMLNWIRYDCNVFAMGMIWVFERDIPTKYKVTMSMNPTAITVMIHYRDWDMTDLEEIFFAKDYGDACETFNQFCMVGDMPKVEVV